MHFGAVMRDLCKPPNRSATNFDATIYSETWFTSRASGTDGTIIRPVCGDRNEHVGLWAYHTGLRMADTRPYCVTKERTAMAELMPMASDKELEIFTDYV